MDWSRVYEATFEDLARFLYRKVWDEERARDLAQEVFVRALSQQEAPREPRAWLFAVAANLARDEARAAGRRRRHLRLIQSEEEARREAPPRPERAVERREESERVRAALERLGERDRETLLLWDAGLSYAEIAERTGLSEGSVGTTLARARRRLAEAWRSMGESDAARG